MAITLNQEEVLRYARHLSLSEVGISGQQKLKQAKVLCVGAGGLGSPVLLYLAAAGVGTLGIVDDDDIEISNLQRQILYDVEHAGKSKAQTAKERLLELNPNIEVAVHAERLNEDNALDLVSQYDIVVDGTDNYATRYLINDACFHNKKPNVCASIFQFEGQCSVFCLDDGPCYRCLFPSPPPAGLVPNCAEGGVMGVLPGIMGSLQAAEVIKIILGQGEPLKGRLLQFDMLHTKFNEFPISRDENCRLCGHNESFTALRREPEYVCSVGDADVEVAEIDVDELKKLQDSGAKFTLLDVRKPFEVEICNIGGQSIPLDELSARISELDRELPIIVHCKLGGRSKRAARILQDAGFESVSSLKGGIIAWIESYAPNLLRY